ncbi:protein RRP5 homolog [Nephila pilipes]|uniref:Protein RRP5 homolog n=1 Tax=Nephila pilipes TaxID=299642 RepID=A0A8X6NAY6_NEPPI|nr:protein RRP5 homolog [Nephila pilipes]GFT88985.1 protein RRP5 homolog [Nephila pilipes]
MNIKEFDPNSQKFEELENEVEADALVSTYPDSSKAWIIYMIYHLKLAEVTKARMIAKRGIQTINFRKDDEKLNVWKALLNLEAHYGSRESLFSIFEEALIYNDKKKAYFHMLELLIDADKTEEIESFSERILKHFKNDKDVYLILCNYYMKTGKRKEARNFYGKSLQCLPNKQHPDIMGRFAFLEYKYGDIERSFSLFEEVLVKYPKRRDLRNIFVHILKSTGQEERANSLL